MKKRLYALDVFRGMTIAGMILVNCPGSWSYVYAPLRHAEWNGWTPTDLVFPFFLFIVGVAMWFSFKKHEHQLTATTAMKIVRRTLLIFFVGLLLNIFPDKFTDFENWRIFGVLQRIALAFGGAAFLALLLKKQIPILIATLVILLGYWGILLSFGDLTLEGNFVRSLDLQLVGDSHLYHGYRNVAGERVAFDPEGFLSTLPSIATVLLGYLTGQFIGTSTDYRKVVRSILIAAVPLIVLAYIWHPFFPINKPIWSSSYVLLTAGLGLLVLGVSIYLIDILGIKAWAFPFVVFGTNSLFAYVLHSIIAKLLYKNSIGVGDESVTYYTWIYEQIFQPILGNYNGSLAFALSFVLVCWLITYVLYRRQIFIKL